jgi:hypothetical protein
MTLLTRKRTIFAKIESVYAQDPAPTAALDALLMSNLSVSPMEMTLAQRQNIKAYMGNNPNVIAATYSKVSFDIEMAGSGTAGVAPAYDELFRACGLSATTLAAAVTGTATAGTVNGMSLATTASAVDGAYVGLTVNLTGGAGAGQSAVIASYVGATKAATFTAPLATAASTTTVYTIPAQVVYQPVSTNLESITLYCAVDSVKHVVVGARGTVSLKASAQGIPMWSFAFTGLYVPPTDAAIQNPNFTQYAAPLAINNQNTYALNISGYTAAVVSDFSLDLATSVTFRSLPGGTETVPLTDRQPTGSITFEATTVAAKDWWTMMKTVVLGQFSVTHGKTAGNIVKIDCPQQQLDSPAYADKDGITMLTCKQTFNPLNGNDETTICFM